MIIKQIKLQDRILEYSIVLEQRKSIVMRFRNGALLVKAPLNIPLKTLDDWIKSKENWILRHARIQSKVLTDENSMWFMNKKIKIEYQSFNRLGYEINDDRITILCPTNMKHGTALSRVRKQLSISIILPIMQNMIEITQLKPNKIELKSLKRSWGRCDSKRNIRLSDKLIECDPKFIEYVCVHELMHLNHMNHSPEFYQSIERIFPDYKKRRRLTPYQFGYLT